MNTDREKIEIPTELDAKILQYAADKKFPQFRWYNSWAVRAAAVVIIGAAFICTDIFYDREPERPTLAAVEKEELNWVDFEEKMDYLNDEIFVEAQYLAQL